MLDMDVGDGKNPTRITLHGVPSFLVDAFAVLDTNKDWMTEEGVFRIEGSSTRMRNFYVANLLRLDVHHVEEFTTHDICSLIKRFFRVLQPSLFMDKQREILKFAEKLQDHALLQRFMTFTL